MNLFLTQTIAQRFDKAAPGYDGAAMMQAQVAQHLVDWAMLTHSPVDVLDIGSGTGFVAAAVKRRWPQVQITVLDSAPNMLRAAEQKIPGLKIISGDAAHIEIPERFDLLFCSMLLHWLPEPHKILRRWQGWLKPGGSLIVALLVEGSFREWRDLCAVEGLEDGLWPMPRSTFAENLAIRAERRTISVAYPSALEFLRVLKATGASASRDGHVPLAISSMRRILARAPQPFAVTYETVYIELPSSLNI